MLADDYEKRVMIVDTSNEIGGDGDIPHPGIGNARRLQVPNQEMQHKVCSLQYTLLLCEVCANVYVCIVLVRSLIPGIAMHTVNSCSYQVCQTILYMYLNTYGLYFNSTHLTMYVNSVSLIPIRC
jgi:hypothetical protein